jgi:hypothetical protein
MVEAFQCEAGRKSRADSNIITATLSSPSRGGIAMTQALLDDTPGSNPGHAADSFGTEAALVLDTAWNPF